MRDLRVLGTQLRYAMVVTMRSPRAVFFSIIFPIVLLVLFNSIFTTGDNENTTFAGGSIDTAAYFTAGLAAYAIMQQTFSALAITVTTQRETGQLKRLRGTPMPAWTFMSAYILRSIILVLGMVVVLFVIGALGFGVDIRTAAIPGLVVYVALGTAALAALGIAITIFAKSPEVASTIGPFGAVILSFISGVFIPVSSLPDWLESIGRVFPLYHLAEGMQRCLQQGGGNGLSGENLAVLAVWGLAGLAIAARRFRWEPQAAAG